jgi:hypothetical protein
VYFRRKKYALEKKPCDVLRYSFDISTFCNNGIRRTYFKVVASSGRSLSANVGVYSDSGCTQAASSINWGNLAPGNNATFPLWIKNNGSSNLTLTMATTGWSPSNATQGITVNWDRQNTVSGANQTLSATLTLIVSPPQLTAALARLVSTLQ